MILTHSAHYISSLSRQFFFPDDAVAAKLSMVLAPPIIKRLGDREMAISFAKYYDVFVEGLCFDCNRGSYFNHRSIPPDLYMTVYIMSSLWSQRMENDAMPCFWLSGISASGKSTLLEYLSRTRYHQVALDNSSCGVYGKDTTKTVTHYAGKLGRQFKCKSNVLSILQDRS